MGQIINAKLLEGSEPSVRHFELDRGITGMGTCEYFSLADASGDLPADLLARRLFEISGVVSVFIYGNVVSIHSLPGTDWQKLLPPIVDVIRNLFIHYEVNRV